MSLTETILSQIPGNPLDGLRRTDALWTALRQGSLPIPPVVHQSSERLTSLDWDGVICGGTLGILLGTALAQRGWRVALLERGMLRGREQEWNISRAELNTFVTLGLLTQEELERAIATEFNPVRVSFLDGSEVWVRDVLNIGVDPVYLLDTLKQKFLAAGGQLFEQTPFTAVTLHANGASVQAGSQTFQTRLLLDGMGHFSPIVQQGRAGRKPDAVCLVVGSCATGFPENTTGDLMVSFTPIQNQCQYFWEAFPARAGRTTYLFTYLDAHPDRPSLEQLTAEYFRLLPQYQSVELVQLHFQRFLCGVFPCYRQGPLRLPWDRILPIGDSSGSQSPLSFGGFGAMVRHLKRLTDGIGAALQVEALDRRSLSLLHPYQPNLSVTWLFQRSMSLGVTQKIAPNQINQLLATVFREMEQLGDPVLKPFLQDVIQFPGLFQTLIRTSLADPGILFQILPQVGLPALLEWSVHYANLAGYTTLYTLGSSIQPWIKQLPLPHQYRLHRWLDAWKYGSGNDYSD